MPRYVDVVLTGVQSLTHLVYASSYLRRRLKKDKDIEGIRLLVLPTDELRASFGDNEIRGLLPRDERLSVVMADPTSSWWRTVGPDCVLLSIGAPGTRALSRLLQSRWGRKPLVVVVDEGLGSYGNLRSRRAAYLRKGGAEPRATVRAAAVAAANAVVPDVRWSLYERRRKGWVVHEKVAAEFRRHLDDQRLERPTVVYLTQPWVELGAMTPDEHARHVYDLRTACEDAGYALGIRPHPRDDPARYGDAWIMTKRSAAEFDRRIARADLLIGANSTAMLNIRAIHGTRVLRVTTPGLTRLDATLSARQHSLLDALLPPAVTVAEVGSRLPVG
ncbi:polysialyltransferase family glycosyltransferase [Terracoccus luteus]|jgi:hypothetical protein|uniref:CDP-glycerol:poly(Glycerophosphate) glycerophosphotransferase n=1 Tax=Terracoccus luteus TaxID=53356 RepID=A0A495XX44_9MICO|nr:polysialyltransferase family glycosyltransferase [Terracoccus luteus]MBB2985446.1 hypothetical protein [Terracoccus luteus]MCP2171098.1 hypothetical protein [Terracoccus luteus]RKT77296.1 hypothetical protein DFJ68_0716 [Terracoccus luteus]